MPTFFFRICGRIDAEDMKEAEDTLYSALNGKCKECLIEDIEKEGD